MGVRRALLAVFAAAINLELTACGDDAVAPGGGVAASDWEAMESGTENDINALWAASASDVFAVGASGTIRAS